MPDDAPDDNVSESDTPPATPPATPPKDPPKDDAKPIVPPKTAEELAIGGGAPPVDLDSMDYAGILTHAGLAGKEEEMAATFLKDGKLSDEHYAALKKIGVPKAVANRTMQLELSEARAKNASIGTYHAEAVQIAGGEKELETLRSWAVGNMPRAKLERLDKMVKEDPSTYPDYIATIARHHKAEGGKVSSNSPGHSSQPASGTIKGPKDLSNTITGALNGDAASAAKLKNTSIQDIMKL